MIRRTVSVDNIIEQSPNDWRGMSDPDRFNPNLLNVDMLHQVIKLHQVMLS